ncbi:MAG: tRNA (5-methylaminomethyl-2-thiouridine)(34)-methyltransferase MnmD [Bacteroidales bacterium]
MKREIVITSDGSSTLRLADADECYHSVNGALSESLHIFIKNGLERFLNGPHYKDFSVSSDNPVSPDSPVSPVSPEVRRVRILEAGLGTGLNTLLTCRFINGYNAANAGLPGVVVDYIAIEKFPVTKDELEGLNYGDIIGDESGIILDLIHSAPWGEPVEITPFFTITKLECGIESLSGNSLPFALNSVDIVYFDAFSPNIQPELWSREIFEGLYGVMSESSLLITYSSKGIVKSALIEAGFTVSRLQGPAGKRHITLAVRSGTF